MSKRQHRRLEELEEIRQVVSGLRLRLHDLLTDLYRVDGKLIQLADGMRDDIEEETT